MPSDRRFNRLHRWLDKLDAWMCKPTSPWHTPGGKCEFDGATVTSRCCYCNRRIGQDSQGNWFDFAKQD